MASRSTHYIEGEVWLLVHFSFPESNSLVTNTEAEFFYLELSATCQPNVAHDSWQLGSGRFQRWFASAHRPPKLGTCRAQGKTRASEYKTIGLYCELFGWVHKLLEGIFSLALSRAQVARVTELNNGQDKVKTLFTLYAFCPSINLYATKIEND